VHFCIFWWIIDIGDITASTLLIIKFMERLGWQPL
jgi:hypothetical protein